MQAKSSQNAESSPSHLLDVVARHVGARNDTALAITIGVGQPEISKVRHGRAGVTALLLLRIHDATRIPVNDLRQLAGLPTVQAVVPREV